jgi:hypothetical protein
MTTVTLPRTDVITVDGIDYQLTAGDVIRQTDQACIETIVDGEGAYMGPRQHRHIGRSRPAYRRLRCGVFGEPTRRIPYPTVSTTHRAEEPR